MISTTRRAGIDRLLSGQGPLGDAAAARPTPGTEVFAASWCCSVGMSWTLELRPVDRAAPGRPTEWICSGVPNQQPAPERQTVNLLRERGLLLFPAEPVDPVDSPPRSRSRRPIGFVTRNPELMRLALALTKVLDAGSDHAMIVAARWMRQGYAADTTLRWVASGVTIPELAHARTTVSGTPPG